MIPTNHLWRICWHLYPSYWLLGLGVVSIPTFLGSCLLFGNYWRSKWIYRVLFYRMPPCKIFALHFSIKKTGYFASHSCTLCYLLGNETDCQCHLLFQTSTQLDSVQLGKCNFYSVFSWTEVSVNRNPRISVTSWVFLTFRNYYPYVCPVMHTNEVRSPYLCSTICSQPYTCSACL